MSCEFHLNKLSFKKMPDKGSCPPYQREEEIKQHSYSTLGKVRTQGENGKEERAYEL